MDKTLAKGLSVLDYLVEAGEPCGVADVARQFGLVRSNAHRTLQTLVALGYVRQTADARYQASLRLFEMGAKVVGALDIREAGRPAMASLAAETHETIHLVVRDGDHVVYLDKRDSPQPVAAYSHIGGRAPAQCVATGKALLAAELPQDEELALAWLAGQVPVLPAYTPASHSHHAALLADLREVRVQGYGVNRGEWRADVSGLGAAVFDHHGRPIGAVGISLPSVRATDERMPALASALMDAAAAVSATMGYRPAR